MSTGSTPPTVLETASDPAGSAPSNNPEKHGNLLGLTLAALGIVYGDIGTSPLYALRECFHGPHAVAPTPTNVLGVLSMLIWALIIVISIKYLLFVMRADNRGEGGILALMALTLKRRNEAQLGHLMLFSLGIFSAALFYGDGMITPAISVLSAVEGLKVATPFFEPYVIPITLTILVGLFSIQRRGTAGIGVLFGPVTMLWFLTMALLGAPHILEEPGVLGAINPVHAVQFFIENQGRGFMVLGSVFLVVTGGEALYADMGHFGRSPIRLAWFALVLPALLLNYLGQGAMLLRNPAAAANPFYLMAPPWALYPIVGLATMATVIASQAVISGAFSLTRQAVQLGLCPRVEIVHTSEEAAGQIYVPGVNWALLVAVIALVLSFGSSSRLAAAYGIAVSMDGVITTTLLYVAARNVWGWSRATAGMLIALFLTFDLAFFGANALKIADGGWFPLMIGGLVFTLLTTWKRGRKILSERLKSGTLPVDLFLPSIAHHPPARVKGTAVFMVGNPDGVPHALLHNLKHNKVLHDRVVFLTVSTGDVPRVQESERLEVQQLDATFFRVVAHFGFMESPNIPALLERCKEFKLEFNMMETTFFLGRETLIPTKHERGMALWREKLFVAMSRNSRSATDFFHIPPNRVVELGAQIEL